MESRETFSRIRSLHGASGSRPRGSTQHHQTARRGTSEAGRTESESAWAEAETESSQAFRFGPRLARCGLVQWRRGYFASDLIPRQSLPDDLAHRHVEAFAVSQRLSVEILPIVETEHLLIDVGLQVRGIDTHVSSLQSALEQTPEILHTVRMNSAFNVAFQVIDDLMREGAGRQALIPVVLIGVQRGPHLHIRHDIRMKFVVFARRGNSGLYTAFTLQQSEHDGFTPVAILHRLHLALAASMHVCSLAANIGFVGLDFITQLRGLIVAQCKPDAMENEPSRFLADSSRPVKLVGTRTVFAISQHPHGHEPLVERNRGILEDGANLDAELSFGMPRLALPNTTCGDVGGIGTATRRTDHRTVRPAPRHKIGNAVVRVRKVDDCILKGLRFACHESSMRQES